MTRIGALLTAAAVAALAAAAFVPWPVSEAVHRLDVAPQVGGLAGLTVTNAGTARFTLLPVPRLDIIGLKLASADGRTVLDVPRVRARSRLFSLVGGRFDVTALTLRGPRLTVPSGETALPVIDALFGAGTPERPHVLLDRIAVINGAVIESAGTGLREVAGSIDLLATRPGSTGSVDLEGRSHWRGQPIAVTAKGFDLKALIAGAAAPLKASVTTPLGSIDFDGTAITGPAWQAGGTLRLATPAIDRLSDWLDLPLPVPLAGSLTLAATSMFRPDGISLDGARLTLPAGVLEGALSLKRVEGYPSLRGTLASDRLDLTALVGGLPDMRAEDGRWNREPFDPDLLPRGDVDLRLSAGRIMLGQTSVGSAAISVLSRSGRTDIALANAEMFRGDVRARVSLAQGPRGLEAKLGGTVDRADAAALLQGLSSGRRLGGILHATWQLESAGESIDALIRGLEGRAAITVRQGDLVGVNLPEVLKRIEKRPLVAALDMRGGRTPFDIAHGTLRVTRGVVEINEALLQSPAARVTVSGQIALGDRLLGLSGLAQLMDGAGEAGALPFDLTGTFDEPLVLPDAGALVRRAGGIPRIEPRPDAFAAPAAP